MKKSTGKKLLGVSMVVMLVAVVGAVITTAETDDSSSDDETQQDLFFGKHCRGEQIPFFSELTDEQKEEIEALRESLEEEGASAEDIRAAVQEKLEEFGVAFERPELTDEELDEQLDTAIERAEQQHNILNRKKELREDGYSWEEIEDVIQEEFDLSFPAGGHQGMMKGPGFHGGPCSDPQDFMSDTDSYL